MRRRKAYSIVLRGYEAEGPSIVYAPTPAKAKAELFLRLQDAWGTSWPQFIAMVRSICRHPERDVVLPKRDALATQINPDILHRVVHAYGGRGRSAGYRDHYVTHDSDWIMKAAYYHGLFLMHRGSNMFGKDMLGYTLTPLGRALAAGEVATYPEPGQ